MKYKINFFLLIYSVFLHQNIDLKASSDNYLGLNKDFNMLELYSDTSDLNDADIIDINSATTVFNEEDSDILFAMQISKLEKYFFETLSKYLNIYKPHIKKDFIFNIESALLTNLKKYKIIILKLLKQLNPIRNEIEFNKAEQLLIQIYILQKTISRLNELLQDPNTSYEDLEKFVKNVELFKRGIKIAAESLFIKKHHEQNILNISDDSLNARGILQIDEFGINQSTIKNLLREKKLAKKIAANEQILTEDFFGFNTQDKELVQEYKDAIISLRRLNREVQTNSSLEKLLAEAAEYGTPDTPETLPALPEELAAIKDAYLFLEKFPVFKNHYQPIDSIIPSA